MSLVSDPRFPRTAPEGRWGGLGRPWGARGRH